MPQDELEVIDGIKPNVWLPQGEEREVSSQTSNSVYKVKRTMDHYYCTCPAWRNQGGNPVNARTCKHLMALLGDQYEIARLKMKNPNGPPPKGAKGKAASKAKATKAKPAAKAPTKRKRGADDDEDDEDEGPSSSKSKKDKAPPAKRGRKETENAEEEDLEEVEEDDEDVAATGKSVPELLLANKWDIEKGPDPTGWWISEKLDGVRTFYDGEQFYSRLGNAFTPPNWFLDKLPKDVTLDGELYGGRGEFQSTVSIVKTANSVHWKNISFQIFDVPSRGDEPFEERYKFLQSLFGEEGTHKTEQIFVVEHELAKSRQHVLDKLKEVEGLGGEGLMLRKPASVYEGRRSGTLLKIKTFYDAEAIVTGYAPGKGRNKGTVGALKCEMESGKAFNVGSGLTDKQRKDPPKVGSIIIYRFQELTRDGVPRFPSFVGVAIDKDKPKDAEIPEHRRVGTTAA
ncbi:DNA ligase/mRNA capping enzyme [Agrocybe pediades]|nr:DNA ligase/mRNA capping enzyme [Agrocybe pediades]